MEIVIYNSMEECYAMKSSMEVVAEMFVKGLEAMEDKDQSKYCRNMLGKTIQLTFLNMEETVIFYFEKMEVDGKFKNWLRYESHSYPEVRCKSCAWKGFYGDLPKEKRDLVSQLQGEAKDSAVAMLAEMTGFETMIKCPTCGSKNLQWRHWMHPHADVVLYCRSHWDIGNFGTVVMGPIPQRLKGLIWMVYAFIRGWVSMKPFSKVLLVLKFASLFL